MMLSEYGNAIQSVFVEGPVGFEPTTPCLKGRCSNQLSYGPLKNIVILSYLQQFVNLLMAISSCLDYVKI